MTRREKLLADKEVADAAVRRVAAAHLQAIEDCPPSAVQLTMFEMFERERWSHDRRLAYIRERARSAATVQAAE